MAWVYTISFDSIAMFMRFEAEHAIEEFHFMVMSLILFSLFFGYFLPFIILVLQIMVC